MKQHDIATLLLGAAMGAGAMYLFDPAGGRRRRALVRDKARRTARVTRHFVDRTSRDMVNRSRGMVAELRKGSWRTATDDVLVQRVRSAIGRVVSHPHALEVDATQGRVRLTGPILASEVDAALDRTRAVRGVTHVENELEVHDSPENTPALQGGDGAPDDEPWLPLAKLIVGVGSAVALGASLARASALPAGAERI